MITAYYTEIKTLQGEQVFEQQLNKLPGEIKEKILAYTSRHEQLSRLCGKFLLSRLLADYQTGIDINDMHYNEWGKPYFNDNFDFNIAHSGNIVICAGTLNARIGVDIEKYKDMDISLLQEHFTENEWNRIICSEDKNAAFYKMWVRKEACLKAIGKGSFQPMQEIDVCKQAVIIGNTTWYLHDISIKSGYSGCIASDTNDKINIIEVNLNTLINENLYDA